MRSRLTPEQKGHLCDQILEVMRVTANGTRPYVQVRKALQDIVEGKIGPPPLSVEDTTLILLRALTWKPTAPATVTKGKMAYLISTGMVYSWLPEDLREPARAYQRHPEVILGSLASSGLISELQKSCFMLTPQGEHRVTELLEGRNFTLDDLASHGI